MTFLEKWNELREKWMQLIAETDAFLRQEQGRTQETQSRSSRTRAFETLVSLEASNRDVRNKRPIGVVFSDGARKDVSTWKQIYVEVLQHCNREPGTHQALMNLRGKICGRTRVLLGSEAGSMTEPVQIDQAMYVETHNSAEALMNTLVRILTAAGWDYRGIRIAVENQ